MSILNLFLSPGDNLKSVVVNKTVSELRQSFMCSSPFSTARLQPYICIWWSYITAFYLRSVVGQEGSSFISAAFNSHTRWSNAHCFCAPTTTMLPTIANIFYGLNYFGRMISTLKPSTYQNTEKFSYFIYIYIYIYIYIGFFCCCFFLFLFENNFLIYFLFCILFHRNFISFFNFLSNSPLSETCLS